jgi:hypothetical protein
MEPKFWCACLVSGFLLVGACSDRGDTTSGQNPGAGGSAGSAGTAGTGGSVAGSTGALGAAGTTASGGSGGSNGTGGISGSNGSAGTAGTEGAGGSSGASGAGGSSGSAGSAGAAGSGGQAGTPGGMGTPPATWTEHWFEHDQTLALVDHNDWVALYFDPDVSRTGTEWMLPFLTEVWKYTVTHYGQFTDGQRDGRLYAIYHQGRYSGGHPSTYFDSSHDYRNVSDVGPGPYPDGSYDISTHEVSHIIEGASRGVQGSPAFGLWGDSKWAEIYQYDLYLALGMTEHAARVFQRFTNASDDFPRPGTRWFRDWFHPIWRDHGGVAVLASYFRLLSQHFPKNAGGTRYVRDLNFGEFVHFMSGAARTNLEARATTAFGWPAEREAEFTQAQADFPGITY